MHKPGVLQYLTLKNLKQDVRRDFALCDKIKRYPSMQLCRRDAKNLAGNSTRRKDP